MEDVQFYTIEEARQYKTTERNWPLVLKDFETLLNKHWIDKNNIQWKIIGLEDTWSDYYWIVQNKEGKIQSLLYNDPQFYNQIV